GEGCGWNRSVASHRQAPRRGHRHVVVGRPWHRTVDRRDVPDLSAASARRVAGWGLRRSQRLRTGLRLEAATDAEGAGGPGRTLPALPHRGRLVLLESSQRTAKTAQMTSDRCAAHAATARSTSLPTLAKLLSKRECVPAAGGEC